ncbi:MAG: hypothetical protein Tsb0015_07500 [Simkaniaceae bacterium]
MICFQNNIFSSLLPQEVIEGIQAEKIGEKAAMAAILLTANTAFGAAEAWEKGNIKSLDPNPGDGGCQLRGYLHHLISGKCGYKRRNGPAETAGCQDQKGCPSTKNIPQ